MTPSETVVLTRYVKACTPQQAIDEYTPDAWHDILGDLEFTDCRVAVVAIKKRSVFVDPSEIRAEVKRIRRDRLERTIAAAPSPEIADNARNYRAALQNEIRKIADGRTRWLEIAPPVREDGPPGEFTEARAALGPALPSGRHQGRSLQEIALQQAAESRAARARQDAESGQSEPEAS